MFHHLSFFEHSFSLDPSLILISYIRVLYNKAEFEILTSIINTNYSLRFVKAEPSIFSYADANWATDLINGKSISGNLVYLYGNLVGFSRMAACARELLEPSMKRGDNRNANRNESDCKRPQPNEFHLKDKQSIVKIIVQRFGIQKTQ